MGGGAGSCSTSTSFFNLQVIGQRLQELRESAKATDVPVDFSIPSPYDKVLFAIVAVLLLLVYLQKRHKVLSDAKTGITFLRILIDLSPIFPPRTFVNCFDAAVRKWPNKIAIHFIDDGRKLTFKDIDKQANIVANFFIKQGLKKGDVGAIMMTNKPEYVIMELALAKVGLVSALLNHNLKGEALIHSVQIADAKIVIFDTDLASVVEPLKSQKKDLIMVSIGAGGDKLKWTTSLSQGIAEESDVAPGSKLISSISPDDPVSLVYTSGTTGLPKAAIVKHKRIYLMSVSFARQFWIKHSDKIYCTLPLYHSAGGNIGLGMMINLGATLVLRSKFSASNFFKDVKQSEATVTQYIGELCRYLVATPPSPYDRGHKLRLAFGNGLRPDVWPRFVERFGVKQIGEFYGATEGNIVFFNHWSPGEPAGAIGKGGMFNRLILGWTIVKFDPIKEEPIRDKYGHCIKCPDGEAGELVAKIAGTSEFCGYYKNKDATEKKVLKDAFGTKGKHYFRSGDLLMVDGNSYIHFVDRIGDTFRWKGENVSTTEVALAIGKVPSLEEVNIVGVEVPGKDGRACMAAVTLKNGEKELDLDRIYAVAKENLPAYAIPVFIRLLPTQETTGTFKHMKSKYRTEGIDVEKVTDPLYWLDPVSQSYKRYDKAAYKKILSGEAKL